MHKLDHISKKQRTRMQRQAAFAVAVAVVGGIILVRVVSAGRGADGGREGGSEQATTEPNQRGEDTVAIQKTNTPNKAERRKSEAREERK